MPSIWSDKMKETAFDMWMAMIETATYTVEDIAEACEVTTRGVMRLAKLSGWPGTGDIAVNADANPYGSERDWFRELVPVSELYGGMITAYYRDIDKRTLRAEPMLGRAPSPAPYHSGCSSSMAACLELSGAGVAIGRVT